jgi:HK97 family phage major capsid protein
VANANSADHIHAAMAVAAQSYLQPDGRVVNPADWADLRLVKDSQGNYVGGSPFSTATEPGQALWGVRVALTTAIAEGTALVGSFSSAAQLYRRGGLTVEASNSHADYFQNDLVALRAETRLALAVFRPEAFATVVDRELILSGRSSTSTSGCAEIPSPRRTRVTKGDS